MLLVARRDRLDEVLAIFHKWELDAVEIGRVTDSGRVVLFFDGKIVADLPAAPLSDRAPIYDRPRAAAPPPAGPFLWQSEPEPADYGDVLRRLLAAPNVAEKSWIWTQYDHMVQTNTVERPGGDAAVLRVKGTKKGIAMKSDVNPFFCALDPYRGGAIAVAEAARSVAATGARPLAITDCLNFGNPEKPEVMAQFEAAVRGIADACRALDVPVVSGNVSLYNETDGRAIPPTPTVGMVGLLEDVEKHVRVAVPQVGRPRRAPRRDPRRARRLRIPPHDPRPRRGPVPRGGPRRREAPGGPARDARRARPRRLRARHLRRRPRGRAAECAMQSGLGASIVLDSAARTSALLFGESTGRALISFAPDDEAAVRALAREKGVPVLGVRLGRRRPFPHGGARPSAHRRARRGAGRRSGARPSPTRSNPPTSCRSSRPRISVP